MSKNRSSRSSQKRHTAKKPISTKASSNVAFRAKLTVTDKNMNRSNHNLHFRTDRKAEMGLIKVYPDHLKQHVDGFGAAFTDAAGYVYAQMNPASQERFLSMCFDENEHNYRLCRAPIQSNDFSRSAWSYVTDKNDETLETFSLGKDDQYLIPLIKDALETSDDIKIISSPWSPPAFMKTNRMVRMGGHLKVEYYTRWADVIVRYILAYRKRGIRISALTVQNEPNARQTWESCEMTPEEESNFAINYLKPALVATGLTDVKIFVWDHNKDQLLERVEADLSTDGAATAIDGVAFHWYSGDHFEALREATSEFPNKLFYMTEGCEALPKDSQSDLAYAEHYAHDIIGDFQNGAHGYIDWNILLDETGGPNHASNYCYAPLMYNRSDHHLEVKPAFSYIGHFSRYIRPGARIMLTSRANDDVEVLGAMNPDGEQVLVLLNCDDAEQTVKVHEGDSTCAFTLPEHSIATLRWTTQKHDSLDDAQPIVQMSSKAIKQASSDASKSKRGSKNARGGKKDLERDAKRKHKREDKEIKQQEKDLDSRSLIQKLAGKQQEPRVIKAPENSQSFDASLTHVMTPIERKIVPPDPLIDEPGNEELPVREVTQVINPVKLTPIKNAPKLNLDALDLNPQVTRVMSPIRTSNATTGDSDLESLAAANQETKQFKPISSNGKKKGKVSSFFVKSDDRDETTEHTEGKDEVGSQTEDGHDAKAKSTVGSETGRKKADQSSTQSSGTKKHTKQSLDDLIAELFGDDDTPDEPESNTQDAKAEEELGAEETTILTPEQVQKVLKATKISSEVPSPVNSDELRSLVENRVTSPSKSDESQGSDDSTDSDDSSDAHSNDSSTHEDAHGEGSKNASATTNESETSKGKNEKPGGEPNAKSSVDSDSDADSRESNQTRHESESKHDAHETKGKKPNEDDQKHTNEDVTDTASSDSDDSKAENSSSDSDDNEQRSVSENKSASSETTQSGTAESDDADESAENSASSNADNVEPIKDDESSESDDASIQDIENQIQDSMSSLVEKSKTTLKSISENETTQEAKRQASELAHKSSEAFQKSFKKMASGWKTWSRQIKDASKAKRTQKKPTLRVAPKEVINSMNDQSEDGDSGQKKQDDSQS